MAMHGLCMDGTLMQASIGAIEIVGHNHPARGIRGERVHWTGITSTTRNDAQEAKKQGICLCILKDSSL
jgi:hypothetical protein